MHRRGRGVVNAAGQDQAQDERQGGTDQLFQHVLSLLVLYDPAANRGGGAEYAGHIITRAAGKGKPQGAFLRRAAPRGAAVFVRIHEKRPRLCAYSDNIHKFQISTHLSLLLCEFNV
jgi:hypothetical protein